MRREKRPQDFSRGRSNLLPMKPGAPLVRCAMLSPSQRTGRPVIGETPEGERALNFSQSFFIRTHREYCTKGVSAYQLIPLPSLHRIGAQVQEFSKKS